MEFTSKLGTKFLFVRGTCEYWVNDFEWSGTRSGTLTPEQVAWLEREVHYSELAVLSGKWLSNDCFDPATLNVTDGVNTVSCVCGCSQRSAPNAVREIDQAYPTIVTQLADAASPWDGPLRFFLVEDPTQADRPLQPWPLQRSIDDFTLDRTILQGDAEGAADEIGGFVLDSPDEIAQLRATISAHVNANGPLRGDDRLPIAAGGTTYALYARDDLAF